MSLWFTSDTHFGHANVIGFCNRPWASVEEMNEGLIANWNARVRKNDRVYVLGDFAFKRPAQFLERLAGHKILIKGNHDGPAHKMIAAGFAEVYENELIKLPNGRKVLLSHFPYYPGWQERAIAERTRPGVDLDARYKHKRIYRDFELWLLHGHVHTAWKVWNKQLNVGVDVHDWCPISHETVQTIIIKEEAGA